MPDYAPLHKNPKGPGDQRPTAMQIVENENLVGNMKDKVRRAPASLSVDETVANMCIRQVFLVTGASAGIGVETARALAATGGKVYLAVRNLAKAEKACGDFLEPGRVELLEADTSSQASVRAAAAAFLARESRLNVLVCNAGVMSIPTREVTADGFETQLAVNYLGHFLLFHLLRDALLAGSTPEFRSRLVHVSSSSHHVGEIHFDDFQLAGPGAYGANEAYGQSKLAQIYHANWVDRHLGPRGLHATSLMPGGIMTDLQRYIPAETKESWKTDDHIQGFLKSEAQGAATTVYAAVSADWEGRGGKYLEDCRVATAEPFVHYTVGCMPFIYDEEKEDRLYQHTMKLLGLDS